MLEIQLNNNKLISTIAGIIAKDENNTPVTVVINPELKPTALESIDIDNAIDSSKSITANPLSAIQTQTNNTVSALNNIALPDSSLSYASSVTVASPFGFSIADNDLSISENRGYITTPEVLLGKLEKLIERAKASNVLVTISIDKVTGEMIPTANQLIASDKNV